MNISSYVFGELADGYTQYPDDSSSDLLQHIVSLCSAPSQLIIHRDGNLMYYVYVRKFEKQKYIGFVAAINGSYITQIQPLFAVFEKEIENLINDGVIINLTTQGDITSHLDSLSNEEEEVLSICNWIQTKINALNIKKLPQIDFSYAINSQKIFKNTDNTSEIAHASCFFGFTIVLKEKDFDNLRVRSYQSIFKNLTKEKNTLTKEIEKLREYNKQILRQKKQFKNIIILFFIIIACGVGLYYLNDNLNTTQNQLEIANETLSEKEKSLSVKEYIIKSQKFTIKNTRDSIDQLKYNLRTETIIKDSLQNQLDSVYSICPFWVRNCEVNSNYFKLDYSIPKDNKVSLTLYAIKEPTKGYNTNEIEMRNYNLTLSKGSNSTKLFYYRSLNTSHYYYVFLMYNGRIIAGKRW